MAWTMMMRETSSRGNMDAGSAVELLERLGCRKIRLSSGEVMCSCPHPDNHPRGDRRPSFSAAVDTPDGSPYICYGCHARGTLEGLAIRSGNGDLVPDWKPKNVNEKEWIPVPSTNASKFRHLYSKKKRPVLFKDIYLEPFLGVLSGYLKSRGITKETARAWELGVDKRHGRAIFVVRDMEGRLAVVIGRDVTGRSRIRYSNYVLDRKNKRMEPFIDHKRERDFVSPTKSLFLYGEHKAKEMMQGGGDRRSSDLVVVEGAIDVLKMWQLGWNAVAVLGSFPSDTQMEKLVALTPRKGRLVIMADGDEAGRKLTGAIGKKLGKRLPVFDAQLDEGLDPGEATEDEIDDAMNSMATVNLTSDV